MSPQLVDFNGDGRVDVLAATYDGSPHIAFGHEQGWQKDQTIQAQDGRRIVMNAFWNFDSMKWESTKSFDPVGLQARRELHLTSAWACDYDADGDLDLLLGDHNVGHVMWCRNEGSPGEPKFATRHEQVMAAGKPLVVPGTVTNLRTIDWDHDGLQDLLVGSMGDGLGHNGGAAVLLYRNTGKAGAPAFGEPWTLVAPAGKEHGKATRPNSGLYVDAADLDGDGDPDLLVGGYSSWSVPQPELDDAQRAQVVELKAEIARLQELSAQLNKQLVDATKDLPEDQRAGKRKEVIAAQKAQRAEQTKALQQAQQELEVLEPSDKRTGFVWFYENLQAKAGAGDGIR